LRQEYSLSFWDSLIVAAAFLAGADILYSEVFMKINFHHQA